MCRLGQTTGALRPNKIQLHGASLSEVFMRQRDSWTIDREYDLFLIGEAPGAVEDRTGIPFQGDAGNILQDFAVKAGFDPERTYITNTVKCKPPKNRKPSVAEIKACNVHIAQEIYKYRPKVIMVMGNTALRLFRLQGTGGISKIHGKIFDLPYTGWPEEDEEGPIFKVIPTFHPSYFLQRPNPKLKARAAGDYVLAKKVVDAAGGTVKNAIYFADYKLCESVADVAEMVEEIRQKKIFAFDTESPDLHFMRSPMICMQFSIGVGKNWVLPFYSHDPDGLDWKLKPYWTNRHRNDVTDLLRLIFAGENITKAAHNIKYDLNVIKRWLNIDVKGWLWCTQAMHHLIYEYSPHDLETLSDIEFAVGDYSEGVRQITGKGRKLKKTYDNVPDEILWPYGATDAEMVWKLLHVFYPKLKAKPNLLKLYQEETLDAIKYLAKGEQAGNFMVLPNVKALESFYKNRLEELRKECRELTQPDFNPGSTEQVAKAFAALGMSDKVYAPEKAKGYTTDKAVLIDIDHPLARNVMEYRNSQKMLSTYVENALADIDADGRVRYGFNISGTTSGRLSCRFLHQIPRLDKEKIGKGEVVMRSIFGESKDYLYFYADYSQIELRVFAYLTGEQELIDYLEQGKDIHQLTASAALGIPFDKVSVFNRDEIGKRLNFGVIYGSEGHSISRLIFDNPRTGKRETVGKRRAIEFVRSFRKRYSKVDEFLEDTPNLARCNGGILVNVFGRERRMIGLNDPDEGKRMHAEREATNFLVQGPAGAICLRTINKVGKLLESYESEWPSVLPVRFTNTVHDSISYGVHKDFVDWFSGTFKSIAERPIPELGNKVFPVKMGVGITWTEAELNAM